ncbi:hypothetical protein EYF80_019517 [Liparis tanakae]|uniref:Uncharacterized protein n=1 Tax=Liparis tanakae TaxID=230148 RepID=A0A4Z2HZA0_9TELE|nr:hypothetical protein EYF80_019517 [Liparis tanakae]
MPGHIELYNLLGNVPWEAEQQDKLPGLGFDSNGDATKVNIQQKRSPIQLLEEQLGMHHLVPYSLISYSLISYSRTLRKYQTACACETSEGRIQNASRAEEKGCQYFRSIFRRPPRPVRERRGEGAQVLGRHSAK